MGAAALGFSGGAGPPRPPRPPCACRSPCTNSGSATAIASGKSVFEIRCRMLVSPVCKALLLGGQTSVNRLDKGASGSLLRSVLGLVGLGRMRCLDLIECLSLLDQVRNHIADDDHHIAVIHHVQLQA